MEDGILLNGTLDNITLRQMPQGTLGSDDVGIEVHAAGVNFEDIMNGLDLLSEGTVSGGIASRNLGLEVAGQVATIGKNV